MIRTFMMMLQSERESGRFVYFSASGYRRCRKWDLRHRLAVASLPAPFRAQKSVQKNSGPCRAAVNIAVQLPGSGAIIDRLRALPLHRKFTSSFPGAAIQISGQRPRLTDGRLRLPGGGLPPCGTRPPGQREAEAGEHEPVPHGQADGAEALASMMPTRNVAAAVAAFWAASAAVSEMFSGLMAFLHLRRAG
jgi:hypothetical protein